MLTEHFLPYFGRNLDDNPIFMQDNAPIHTAGRLNCRKRAFFDKITLLLDLGSHFKSVSEATDLDSIVFPVRSNSRTTRFGGIRNTAGILMLFHSHPYRFLITFQSAANFTIG